MKKPRVKIADYKIVTWVDAEIKRKLFGGALFVVGTGWAYLETDGRPAVYWSRKNAQAQLTEMKRRRTRAGYKRAKK